MFICKEDTQSLSEERKRYLKSVRRKKIAVNITKIAILVAFFAIWEIAGQLKIIDTFIMSSPSRIIKTLINLYNRGELFLHIWTTTSETIAGFLIGTVLGTFIAVLLWCSKFLCDVLEPYLVVLNSLPKIALGPIFIVWIGAGPAAIIVITLTISVIVSVLEVLNGFLSTDEEQIRLVKTFGANKMQVLTKVVLPSNVTTIVNSLKINVGMSWVGVIVGEFLVSKAGLGYLIVYGSQVFQLDLVMASVLILAVIATLMYQGVLLFEKTVRKRM